MIGTGITRRYMFRTHYPVPLKSWRVKHFHEGYNKFGFFVYKSNLFTENEFLVLPGPSPSFEISLLVLGLPIFDILSSNYTVSAECSYTSTKTLFIHPNSMCIMRSTI